MLPEEDKKRCSRMTSSDPEYPRMISDTIWMKGDKIGGGKGKRDRTRERFAEEGMEETQGDTVNTKVRSNQRVTKFYQKTTSCFRLQFSIL